MTVKLLSEHHLVFLSLKGGCSGSSESTLVKILHCWKSHVGAHRMKGHQHTTKRNSSKKKTKINKTRNNHQRKTEIISSQRASLELIAWTSSYGLDNRAFLNCFVQSFTIWLPKVRYKNTFCDSTKVYGNKVMQLFQLLRLI